MYYLQSRYYDPAIGRFINADGLVSTGQGILGNNMYAYCGNNPIKQKDECGESATIAGAIAGGFFGFLGAMIHEITDDHKGVRFDKVAACTISGAATGAAIGFVADVSVATFGLGTAALVSVGAGAVLSGANSAFTQHTLTGEIDGGKVASDAIIGGLTNGLCTATSPIIQPVVTGIKEGVQYACSQIASEMISCAVLGKIGGALLSDIGFSAVTGFGAWYGGGVYDLLVRWD